MFPTLSRRRSYRLAPDAVFPDQYHDALAASRAFLSPQVLERYGINPGRVCVSGDSAGGNLAAAVAQEVGNKQNTADGNIHGVVCLFRSRFSGKTHFRGLLPGQSVKGAVHTKTQKYTFSFIVEVMSHSFGVSCSVSDI